MPTNLLQFPLLFEAAPQSSTESANDADRQACGDVEPFGPGAPDAEMSADADPTKAAFSGLADAAARQQALDIQQSWIVEAPAGSGKTGLLIQRFLKLLALGEISSPAEILAITFTRKAAQELRTRVLEQLRRADAKEALADTAPDFERISRSLAEQVLERDRVRHWHLLQSPHQLNIRTIDSFCGSLARSMPLLAGSAAQYRPVNDASPLYEEAARRVLRALGSSDVALDRALRLLLLHRDGRVEDCIALIADMLAARAQWGELVPLTAAEVDEERLDRDVRRHLEHTLEVIVSRGLAQTRRVLPQGWLEDLSSLASRLSAAEGYQGKVSPLAWLAGRPYAPTDAFSDYGHWMALADLALTKAGTPRTNLSTANLGFQLTPLIKPELQELLERLKVADDRGAGASKALCALRELPPASMDEQQWEILKAAFHVLRRALAELELLFAEQKACDFTALALTARQLLGTEQAGAMGSSLPGEQLQHLLVDEMQDTSIGQYRLFERITRFWDGASQTVFLVGDPKQSIYAFRQARVERFLRTQNTGRLGDLPLRPLQLTANFRSQAELVEQFNATFAAILPHPATLSTGSNTSFQTTDVPFTSAVAVRPPCAVPALHWHVQIEDPTWQIPPGFWSEDIGPPIASKASVASEAYAIRLAIEDFLARADEDPAHPGKSSEIRIAVLGRSRAHLAPVLAELQGGEGRKRVPYRAVEIEVLNERPEVLDLLALTRALLHPGDRVAWLAVLRSPVCGLGLADLLLLTGEGNTAEAAGTIAHLVSTNRDRLSSLGQRLLARTWPVLEQAAASVGRSSLATHVERTWRSLGADAILATDALANAQRFLTFLAKLEAGGEALNLHTLERRLQKLYAESSDTDAVVELMTIHKAKGLEWDLVLIPSLERATGQMKQDLLRWFELDDESGETASIVLAPLSGKGEKASQLSRWMARLQSQRELAEAKRLFYVACTRAREELHLYGSVELTKSGTVAHPAPQSLLSASWPASRPLFEQRLAALRKQPALAEEDISPRSPALRFPLPQPNAEPLTLAIAAGAEPDVSPRRTLPLVQRLPLSFDPLARFRPECGPNLPYPPAATLRHAAPLSRPEGSFAARAFGNVVHRFLNLLSRRLAESQSVHAVEGELPRWSARLHQAFRAEGLPPARCEAESKRALRALQATLLDPVGHWLLSPHAQSWTERTLHLASETAHAPPGTLRADLVFLAGSEPLSIRDTHLWIVDFKTAEQGGRHADNFFKEERKKYEPQMESYARACLAAGQDSRPLVLALYYPLLTHLLYWPFTAQFASE